MVLRSWVNGVIHLFQTYRSWQLRAKFNQDQGALNAPRASHRASNPDVFCRQISAFIIDRFLKGGIPKLPWVYHGFQYQNALITWMIWGFPAMETSNCPPSSTRISSSQPPMAAVSHVFPSYRSPFPPVTHRPGLSSCSPRPVRTQRPPQWYLVNMFNGTWATPNHPNVWGGRKP